MNRTVVGIDVGGKRKGFHAVALMNGNFVNKTSSVNHLDIVSWCLAQESMVVAVDAPCRWSKNGSSRLAERELMGNGIWCFSSPTKQRALNHEFYRWMLNGERLYESLKLHRYLRFDGKRNDGLRCIETFPHAIVCAMAGKVIPAKHKSRVRRETLHKAGYDTNSLSNVDLLDAALCAVAAYQFSKGNYNVFGDSTEGFIVVPRQ